MNIKYKDIEFEKKEDVIFATFLDNLGFSWEYKPKISDELLIDNNFFPDFYINNADTYIKLYENDNEKELFCSSSRNFFSIINKVSKSSILDCFPANLEEQCDIAMDSVYDMYFKTKKRKYNRKCICDMIMGWLLPLSPVYSIRSDFEEVWSTSPEFHFGTYIANAMSFMAARAFFLDRTNDKINMLTMSNHNNFNSIIVHVNKAIQDARSMKFETV